jgi:hypothetical protein
MATSCDLDPDLDALISRLAYPLLPADRQAFRVAAESALTGCSGEGLAYRILRPLWRSYFHPPPDPRIGQPRGSGSRRPSKLASAEPIGRDDVRCGGRDRHRLRAV